MDKGNVIFMTGHRGDTRFRAMKEVEAYWEALRGGRGVPKRADIDPRGIENALEYAFILERVAPGLARMRIAGMHLSELMGMEVRGMPISAFIPPAGRNGFSEVLEAVTNEPAVARLDLVAETGMGKPPLEGRMLLLPLQSDLGDISRILGCFETLGPIGRAPRRFTLAKSELCPIARPSDAFDEGAPGEVLRPAPPPVPRHGGFREAEPGFEGKRPPDLSLVKSDE